MAKLVDALCSGRSVRKDVLVRIQFWAQNKPHISVGLIYYYKKKSVFLIFYESVPARMCWCEPAVQQSIRVPGMMPLYNNTRASKFERILSRT